MVVLTFSYRSIKKEAYLRLRYRNSSVSIEVPTEIKVEKSFWDKYRLGSNFKGENKDLQTNLDTSTQSLKKYVLSEINKVSSSAIDKKWLSTIVKNYYNPPQPKNVKIIPHSLLDYFDYYLHEKRNTISTPTRKKWNTVKNKVKRFQKAKGCTFEIKDLNGDFKNLFIEYSRDEHYSLFTIQKELKFIKTLALHAKDMEVPVSRLLKELTLKLNKDQLMEYSKSAPVIYLSFDELEKIKAVEGLPDHLDNARDWLVVSCHTGQRVSDFMRFDKSMIGKTEYAPFIKITQEKTAAEVEIPIVPDVAEILHKRSGEFPRPISDVKYNVYIKEVCKRAGLNEKTKGKVVQDISTNEDETKIRNVFGVYPKWQLVTSHIGRRSFVSNYRDILGNVGTMAITGHKSERVMMHSYAGKGGNEVTGDYYSRMLKAKR